MTIYDIVAIAVIFLPAVIGYKKGILAGIIHFTKLINSLLVAKLFSGDFTQYVLSITGLKERISNNVYEAFIGNADGALASSLERTVSKTEMLSLLEKFPVRLEGRDAIFSDLIDGTVLTMQSFLRHVSDFIATQFLETVGFILLFLIIYLLSSLAVRTLERLNSVPILGSVNRIAGFFFGALQGAALVYMFCLGIDLGIGSVLDMKAFSESEVLLWFYDTNPLRGLFL